MFVYARGVEAGRGTVVYKKWGAVCQDKKLAACCRRFLMAFFRKFEQQIQQRAKADNAVGTPRTPTDPSHSPLHAIAHCLLVVKKKKRIKEVQKKSTQNGSQNRKNL